MKVYQAMGCEEASVKDSIMFCFVSAWLYYYKGDVKLTIHYLEGALHNLDLLTKNVGDEYFYPKIINL